jgi:hypothetical protein
VRYLVRAKPIHCRDIMNGEVYQADLIENLREQCRTTPFMD